MSRGFWDDDVNPTGVVFPAQINLAELAVRLGSIVTFDRLGDVLWLDSFEDGLGKWATSSSGTGGSVAISAARARSGGYSALLTTGTLQGENAHISNPHPFPVLSKFGLEASFHRISDDIRFQLSVAVYNGSRLQAYHLYWDEADEELTYQDSVGVRIVFATGIKLNSKAALFHTAKLVVDPDAGEYVRFTLNDVTYSLANITPSDSASATLPHIETRLLAHNPSGGNRSVYVDDVILTQNEP